MRANDHLKQGGDAAFVVAFTHAELAALSDVSSAARSA
jgi:hypothetical protein